MKIFRDQYMKVINDKHEDVMAKFGAILALGILNAGIKINIFINFLNYFFCKVVEMFLYHY